MKNSLFPNKRIFLILGVLSLFFFSFTTDTFAANRYWVGTAGANTNVTSSWSTVSGGTSGASVPGTSDIAIFDGAGAFNTNATINATWSVAGISITANYSAIITQAAGITVTVGTSNFNQAGGTWDSSTGTFDDNGSFTISGGTFTPPSTSFTVAYNFTWSSGTYNGVGKIMTFDSINYTTLTCSNTIPGQVVINKSAHNQTIDFTISTDCSVNLGDNPSSVFAGYPANIINNGTITINSGSWTISGSGYLINFTNNGTINHSGITWTINNLSGTFTNATSGVINFLNGTGLTINGNFTQNGTFNSSASLITTYNTVNSTTMTCSMTYPGKVVINKTSSTGNFTFTLSSGCSINFGDNPNSVIAGGSNVSTFVNNGTITINSGEWSLNNGYIWSFTNNGTINHNGTVLTINNLSGTFTNATSGVINFPSGATTTIKGSFANWGVFNVPASHRLVFDYIYAFDLSCNGVLSGIVVINKSNNTNIYNDSTISSGCSINLGDNPTINLNSGAYNGTAYKLINNGTMTVNSGTLTINAPGSGRFNFLNNGTINHSGNILDINNGDQTFTNATSGVINFASGATTTVDGSFVNNGTFNIPVTHRLVLDNVYFFTLGCQGTMTGTVIINKTNNSNIYGDSNISSGCTINLGDNPTINLNSGAYSGATYKLINNGTMNISSGTLTMNGPTSGKFNFLNNGTINHSGNILDINNGDQTFTNATSGVINFASGATTTYQGFFINTGTLNVPASYVTVMDGSFSSGLSCVGTFPGKFILSKPFATTPAGSEFTLYSGCTINLGDNPTVTLNPGYYSNGMTNNGTMNITSGTLTMSGWSGNFSFLNNGTINHSGTVWDINNGSNFFTNATSGVINFASGATTTMEGSFTNTGTFNVPNSHRLVFDGYFNTTITCNGSISGKVSFTKSYYSSGGAVTLASGCSINIGSNPILQMNGYNAGTFTNNGTMTIDSGLFSFVSARGSDAIAFTNNGTINHNGTSWDLNLASVSFTNSVSGIVNFTNGTSTYVTGNFYQNGTFNVSSSSHSLIFDGAYNTIASGTINGSLVLNKTAANTLTLANNITVENFTLTSGTLANVAKVLTINGNLTVTPTANTYFGGASLSVVMSGSSDANITAATGTVTLPLTISKTGSAKVTLQGNYTGSGASSVITVNSGALYLNGKTLSATTTINNGGELQIQGGETFTTPTLNTGSTLTYVGDGDGLLDNYNILLSNYYNLKINASDGLDIFTPSFYLSQYPALQNDTYVKATSKVDTSFWPYFATDPAKSLTGASASNSWATTNTTNQRFHIDLGSSKVISRIYYENYHVSGISTDIGVKNFTIWGSNTAGDFSDLTYANNGTWVQLNTSQSTFDQHVVSNTTNPKYIDVTNSVAYRYYAFKFANNWGNGSYLGVRRIELQSSLFPVYNSLPLNGSLSILGGNLSSTTALSFTGSSQTITLATSTTFASLTAGSTTASTTLYIANNASSPLIITGTTTFRGASTTATYLKLRSANEGNYWYFNPQRVRDIQYVDVSYSYNQNATAITVANPSDITDSGHNYGWTLSVPTLTLSRQGSQIATTTLPVTNFSLGGAYTLSKDSGEGTITSLTLHQRGSLSADTYISNLKLWTKNADTCAATKPVDAVQFGTGSATFTDNIATTTGSLTVTASTTCLYVTYDVNNQASYPDTDFLGRTIDLEFTNPTSDIVIAGNTITPTNRVNIQGITMIISDDSNYTEPTTSNPACSDNLIRSLLSIHTVEEDENPTLYYLQNCQVWKKVGNRSAYYLTNPNLQVHDLTFRKQAGGLVGLSITISNMDPGDEDVFMNVTKTLRTASTVRVWRGE